MKVTKGTFNRVGLKGQPPRVTEGYLMGNFGIHKGQRDWFVTHVPSGMMVSQMDAASLASAKHNVTVAEGMALDWSASDMGLGLEEYPKGPRGVIDYLRRNCKR